MKNLLSQAEIENIVREHMDKRVSMKLVKDIFESGAIQRLKGAEVYYGKVRVNFYGQSLITRDKVPLRVIVTTDNLSTHDIVRGVIPLKGQVLNRLSNYMFNIVKGFIPNAQLATPGPSVVIAENCKPIDVEMVLRKYMAKSTTDTSLYHNYVNLGKREFCGHKLPNGLKPNQQLPYLMDTPSTKDRTGGHDISVAPKYLFDNNILLPEEYALIKDGCVQVFSKGSFVLASRGIILVDTKFELGRNHKGEIVFIDEVLTPDASRYWMKEDYEQKYAAGEEPTSYSKQFARDIGKPGKPFTEDEVFQIACRYIESYQLLTGEIFKPDTRDPGQMVIEDVNRGLDEVL